MKIELYTDGSSRGNPGPGGYAAILKAGCHYRELSAGFRLTTNNRMEVLSVIAGLEALNKQGSIVHVFSDSKYVVDSINKGWVFSWVKKGFAGKKNKDLWLRFLKINAQHQVLFHWIKGHNSHPENERCDELAVQAATSNNLSIDFEYEAVNA